MNDRRPSLSSPGGSSPVRVLKFGGTSVGTAEAMRCGVRIVTEAAHTSRPVAVVSAAAGVTDLLARAADSAPHSSTTAEPWVERVADRYRTLAVEVLADETLRTGYESTVHAHLGALRRHLLERPVPEASAARDAVLAIGERLMSPLLAAALVDAGCRARAVDASSLLRTDAAHGAAAVDWAHTRRRIRDWHAQREEGGIPVVTGFIGSTANGNTTTLGRGGSDYSAALMARALEAERLERWTDVEALYTSDPAENADARRLSRIPMEQARDWTKEGRLGLHPRTLDPLSEAGIPVHVRCTHRPGAPGTRIVPSVSETPDASSV